MKLRKTRKPEMMLPLTSMGDIAFLLTIFFILTSNFAKDDTSNIRPPTAAELEQMEQKNLSVSIDADGKISFNGREVGSADVIEAGVAAYMVGRKTAEERMVVFRCDKDVDKAVFEPVIGAISKGGGVIVAVGEKKTDAAPKPN